MPEGNPMGYFMNPGTSATPVPGFQPGMASMNQANMLAALLGQGGAAPPSAFTAEHSDLVRRGMMAPQPAPAPTGMADAPPQPSLAGRQQAFWNKFDRMNPAHQQHMARLNAQNKNNPAWVQGYSNWLRGM